jgi:protein TonB
VAISILKFENFNFSENNSASKNVSLSVVFSIAVHIIVIIIVKNLNFTATPIVTQIQENYVDLGYQEFEEAPQIVETKVPEIKDTPEVIPDKADPAPAVAQEMQDQSSDIGGLQKEPPKEQNTAPVATNKNVTDVPYYKVKPKYPKDALLGGLEGHILMQVDIKEDGSVENVKVTGGDKINIFESEARRAVVKWKYKPFTDDTGHPIKKEQHLVRVDFRLVEDQAKN